MPEGTSKDRSFWHRSLVVRRKLSLGLELQRSATQTVSSKGPPRSYELSVGRFKSANGSPKVKLTNHIVNTGNVALSSFRQAHRSQHAYNTLPRTHYPIDNGASSQYPERRHATCAGALVLGERLSGRKSAHQFLAVCETRARTPSGAEGKHSGARRRATCVPPAVALLLANNGTRPATSAPATRLLRFCRAAPCPSPAGPRGQNMRQRAYPANPNVSPKSKR